MEEIKEAAYLSAPKALIYRKIMRTFFKEYEKMRFQVYKEDIFNELKKIPDFEDYRIDDLKSDLDSLVEWKNLTAIQDTKKIYSIAEYKNREFRYSMTEKAVILERAAVQIDNLYLETGNLSTNYILRIQGSLEKIDIISAENNFKEINDLWKILQDDFKRLNQNYQDYLRDFYMKKTMVSVDIIDFISYKQKFVSILRAFIRELQINSSKLENTIENIKDKMEKNILPCIIKIEIENQEMSLKQNFLNNKNLKNDIEENIQGKWLSLKNWFISEENRKSECRQILEITNEIIRKIIQDAFFITQKQNWGKSKKEEYKYFLRMFAECEDIKEAHKLSAHVFGIQKIRHYQIKNLRSTDSFNESIYHEDSSEYILESHNRTYKPKIEKSGFEDREKLKKELLIQHKEKLEEDRKMIMKYLTYGKIDISKINETVSSNFRKFILNMITSANLASDKISRTEYGQKYRLLNTNERFTLKCEDGDLEMPNYIFEFLEEEY